MKKQIPIGAYIPGKKTSTPMRRGFLANFLITQSPLKPYIPQRIKS